MLEKVTVSRIAIIDMFWKMCVFEIWGGRTFKDALWQK